MYDEPYLEPTCYVCEEQSEQLVNIKYWLKDVLKHLYDPEYFDIADLERSLEETAHLVGLKIPSTSLAIKCDPSQTKVVPMPKAEGALLQELLQINQTHLQELKNS